MESYSIRPAVLEDTRGLYSLDHTALASAERRSTIDRAIREARILVVEHSGVVAGYGIISHEFYGRSFLELVYIAEPSRGKGLGPKLIRALEQQSQSTSLFTSTNQSNVHMQHVLESLGYEASGIIHNLDPGDPELVYVKHGLRP
ncbi:MAG: N-acetyltransferase family protein [Planctomycetota bacterium]